MASQLTNYKCPACTGPLRFGAESGKLECEYCGSSFPVEEVEALYAEKETQAEQAAQEAAAEEKVEAQWDTSEMTADWGGEAQKLRTYSCPSCGAELICDETTAATSCPYCGNTTVIPGQFGGDLRPDFVAPFRLDKTAAVEALKKHYKGKLFLPKTFSDTHTVEKLQGVYVPFWLYDGTASGDFRYSASRFRVYRTGDWEVTETDHYDIHRSGSITFEKVPVDASKKMPDEYMDSIEPFDYSQLKPFSTAYLPGFLADKYDVSVEEANGRAKERCAASLEDTVQSSVSGYSTCVLRNKNIRVEQGKVHYALLPVWMMTVNWNGGKYLFAINGQNGKTAGVLPADKKKALGFFAALAAPLALLAWVLSGLIL